jgi:tRNA threonylcarbamoyl adenosine modification protein YeaZ
MKHMLAIDTATSVAVAAINGAVLSEPSEHRHGTVLLSMLDELLSGRRPFPALHDLAAVIVGTGPGNFTGLRIGLATAKTIAYAAGVPLVGVPTPAAIAWAALDSDVDAFYAHVQSGKPVAVLQPAGPADRYLTLVRIELVHGEADLLEPPRVLSPAERIDDVIGDGPLVAVDLDADESIPRSARARGPRALEKLGPTLLHLGARRVAHRQFDDVAELVPTYVTLPRGVIETAERVEWSPALR